MEREMTSRRPACAIGLTNLDYNHYAMGNLDFFREQTVFPHLAVAAGNVSRVTLEAVAARGGLAMPDTTPMIMDGDFSVGLQFPAGAFDLVISQTALSKLDLHE
eukprot:4274799-Prymnesium_polylepis.1